MLVDFAAGPHAVRGPDTAPFVRWLVAQTAARHRDREVCLVCAVEPDGDESWLWLNWLPHARPSNPPVNGPHVATTVEAAADLMTRLGAVVASRRADPTAVPPVLAIVDARLGVSPDDPRLAGAARVGVHLVHLLRPDDPPPADLSTLELSGPTLVWRRPGRPPTMGVADGVSVAYVRDLADHLPD
jgi:DNA segregation ATPase FtsK/SpoIIIE-like protein